MAYGKARTYYTLLVRDNAMRSDAPWEVAFGDYDRDVVDDERDGYADSGAYRVRDMQIIATGDMQQDVDARVAELNGTN